MFWNHFLPAVHQQTECHHPLVDARPGPMFSAGGIHPRSGRRPSHRRCVAHYYSYWLTVLTFWFSFGTLKSSDASRRLPYDAMGWDNIKISQYNNTSVSPLHNMYYNIWGGGGGRQMKNEKKVQLAFSRQQLNCERSTLRYLGVISSCPAVVCKIIPWTSVTFSSLPDAGETKRFPHVTFKTFSLATRCHFGSTAWSV